MKLTLTVTGTRIKAQSGNRYGLVPDEIEPYTVAETTTEGSARYVAATLRALADSLEGTS